MRENEEQASGEDFDLWKLDRDAQEETHQAEFALKRVASLKHVPAALRRLLEVVHPPLSTETTPRWSTSSSGPRAAGRERPGQKSSRAALSSVNTCSKYARVPLRTSSSLAPWRWKSPTTMTFVLSPIGTQVWACFDPFEGPSRTCSSKPNGGSIRLCQISSDLPWGPLILGPIFLLLAFRSKYLVARVAS